MKSKWLRFLLLEKGEKTSTWVVDNKESKYFLGLIKWYPQWRQYCFLPGSDTVYSRSCLRDIVGFIKEQMDKRKKK